MKEPHRKDLASHPDPESCARAGNDTGEALTGAHAGQVSSCEISLSGVPTPLSEAEGNTEQGVMASLARDPAQSKTLSMRGNSLHGNREIPRHARRRWCGGPVGEGQWPYARHARRVGSRTIA